MLIWFKEYTAAHVTDNCHAKMKLNPDIKFNLEEILLATMTIVCHTAVTWIGWPGWLGCRVC